MGFEPTTTEFRSDALTDWAITPWVQLPLRANFVQLLEFHLFVQCARFISVFAFVSRHISISKRQACWNLHIYSKNSKNYFMRTLPYVLGLKDWAQSMKPEPK